MEKLGSCTHNHHTGLATCVETNIQQTATVVLSKREILRLIANWGTFFFFFSCARNRHERAAASLNRMSPDSRCFMGPTRQDPQMSTTECVWCDFLLTRLSVTAKCHRSNGQECSFTDTKEITSGVFVQRKTRLRIEYWAVRTRRPQRL